MLKTIECLACHGSINVSNGICQDCGFDEMIHCRDYDDWLDNLEPLVPMVMEEYDEDWAA